MRSNRTGSPVTLRDVARESGFSLSAVSLVLRNGPLAKYIPDTTKQHIKNVARTLGYSPNQLARALRGQRDSSVGLIVRDLTDPYSTPVLRGIERALSHVQHVCILTDAHNDQGRFEKNLAILLERRVQGIIVVGPLVNISLLSELKKQSVPTVVIGGAVSVDTVSSVMVDSFSGGRLAIEHLYNLGHRKIAFLKGPEAFTESGVRWQGVLEFAKSVNYTIDPRLIVDLPEAVVDPKQACEAGARLTQELIERKRPFTAIMAFDDITALGALHALHKAGIRVPEQCSVIGYDDVTHAVLSIPPLTTVRQPLEMMGETAADIITVAMNALLEKRETQASQVRLSPELVARLSTRAISTTLVIQKK